MYWMGLAWLLTPWTPESLEEVGWGSFYLMGSSLDSRWEERIRPVHIGCVFFPSPPCLFKGHQAQIIQMGFLLQHNVFPGSSQAVWERMFLSETRSPPSPLHFIPWDTRQPSGSSQKAFQDAPSLREEKQMEIQDRGCVKTRGMMTFLKKSFIRGGHSWKLGLDPCN